MTITERITQLARRVTNWSREELLLLGALGALLLGVVVPWYTLPADTLEAFSASLWLPKAMRLLPLLLFVVVARVLWEATSCSLVWAGMRFTLPTDDVLVFSDGLFSFLGFPVAA